MTEVHFEVVGLEDTLRRLRAFEGDLGKSVDDAMEKVAQKLQAGIGGQGTPQQQAADGSIVITAGGEQAVNIEISNSAVPFGLGAFMGAKQYHQFPAWVGHDFDLWAGKGPYVLADTIVAQKEDILDDLLTELRTSAHSVGLEWI